MIEVFKTNISEPELVASLCHHLQERFSGYQVSFDLEDCDNILRVEYSGGEIDADLIINFLSKYQCKAEILPDFVNPNQML